MYTMKKKYYHTGAFAIFSTRLDLKKKGQYYQITSTNFVIDSIIIIILSKMRYDVFFVRLCNFAMKI